MTDKRLNLIKERVEYLEKIKKEGLNLSKRYKIRDIVYYPEQNQYGRIVIDTEEFFAVDFNPVIVYFRRKDEWSKEQLKFLRENYKKLSSQALVDYLNGGEGKNQVKSANKNLKKRFLWTPEKDEFLLKSHGLSIKEIAEKLETSIASVKGRLRRLRAKGSNIKFKNRCLTWTKSKDDILIKNRHKSAHELANMMNTSVNLIEKRLLELSKQRLIPKNKKKEKSR